MSRPAPLLTARGLTKAHGRTPGEQVMTAPVHTARESGTAVLLITHDAQVAAYADREVQLRDGSVAPTGVAA